jgi:poly(3-hydroxybutyrate) depolymerase
MKKCLLATLVLFAILCHSHAQNVFNTGDAIVRLDKTKAYGTAQYPDTNRRGLQKFVSVPTNGVTGTWDASSYKSYFLNVNGVRMAFRLKFPRSYNNADSINKKYPIMLFLHGAGEAGCGSNGGVYNNERQLWLGGILFRDRVDNNQFDGILIYPQLVNYAACSGIWGSADVSNLNILISIIDSVVKYARGDNDRLVINGLSGGGYGAWRMAAAFPQRVAKIIPSAAAGSVASKNLFVHIPIWFATGGKDPDPSPASAQYDLSQMQLIGADIRYTQYPDLGHQVWLNHWAEPDYVSYMNDVHKANPLIFFQHSDFCANEVINAKLGITQGFYAYEWQKDGAVIATATGGVNTIVQPAYVSAYTGNEITVKAFGTYRVRFKRTSAGAWSALSPKPAVIKLKTTTQTPPITIAGVKSKVLPAADGSTTVPLQLPSGFINYEWYRSSDNTLMATTQVYNAPVGTYKARYAEQYGCGTSFSPDFVVINANGLPKPDAPSNLVATALSLTSVRLDWSQVASPASNETGFEIYRGTQAGGPYQLISIAAANVVTYQDNSLVASTPYFYTIRAVNATGASAITTEATAKTLGDNAFPSAPSNLQYYGSTLTSVTLKWTASPETDIKRYDIYANGSKIYSTTATIFNVINLDSLKSFAFTVRAVDNAGNVSPASNQVTGYTHRQGINYKYYTGSWSTLPNFSALTPAKSGITDSVNINNTTIKTTNTQYGFLWQGYIYIPVSATYTFETISDDGSKLYVDVAYSSAATPLVSNDGIHGAQSRTGSIYLNEGYHSIAVTHFQNVNGYDMQLYWSNNAGLARERIQKNFFASATASLGAVPALPSELAATAIAFDKIKVTWTDNSTNEQGFEVARSLVSNGVFTTVGTTSANANNFTDSGLIGSNAYYYKIRAIAASNESSYTAQATATTPATPATPLAPSQLNATGTASSISLTWTDNASNETNYQVSRSSDDISFAVIATLPANANAYTDATVTLQQKYYYVVAAFNAAGTGTQSNTASSAAGDNAPVISSLTSFTVKTNATATEDFVVTDNAGDIVSVTIQDNPSFVTISNIGGFNYRLTVSPTVNNIGLLQLTIVATDNYGKSSNAQVAITIADKNTRSVFVNFGSTGKIAPLPWNNWLGVRAANNIISGLKDEANASTAFSVTTVSAWATTTDLGHISGNNSGVAPDAVLQSGLSDNNASRQIKVSGLSLSKRYNLVFIGSQNEGLAATTDYVNGTQKSTMDARYNTNRSANLNTLIPDATGSILVTLTRTGATANNYLNGLVIEEYDPLITLINPEYLYAEAQDRGIISLTWSDRTNNETGYDLVRATDSLFTQNVVVFSLAANTTTYKNTGLTANTRYWYRVRAKTATLYSEYSNQVRVVTPSSLVYVNFNTTITNAAFPWNNMATSPMTVFTFSNLKNQFGAGTGINLKLEKVFNGEFTAGVNTGANTGVVPDNVLMSDFWLDNTQLSQFRLSGLNHTKRYRIGFIGSSSTAGWTKGNYTATYSINGKTVYLNSWMNSTKIVYIDQVAPDAGGEVLLNFSTTSNALYGFNAGFVIQEYTDTQENGSIPPSNLRLEESAETIVADKNAMKVMVYPNPFRDIIALEFFNTASADRISAEMYDLHGRLVKREVYNSLPAGNNIVRIDGSRIPAGMYLITLKRNGKVASTVKVLKTK